MWMSYGSRVLEAQTSIEDRACPGARRAFAAFVGSPSPSDQCRSHTSALESWGDGQGREDGDPMLRLDLTDRGVADHHVADDLSVDVGDHDSSGTNFAEARTASTSRASSGDPNAAATTVDTDG